MTVNEVIIDDLGQIIFRIETNFSFVINHNYDGDKTKVIAAQTDIQKDIEKLKYLKKKMEIWLPKE